MSAPEADQMSLLERLGGTETLDAAIDEFYFRLVCDEELLVFFEGVDLDFLKRHQRNFLKTACTDHPDIEEAAKRLAKGHARMFRMGLSEVHFDMVAQHLTETLLSIGIEDTLTEQVVANIAPIRAIFEENAKNRSSAGNPHTSSQVKKGKQSDATSETVCSSDTGSQNGSDVGKEPSQEGKKRGSFARLVKRVMQKNK